MADGATSGFEFSMEIYGDDDDTTAIQDQQHKIKFIHLWSFFLMLFFVCLFDLGFGHLPSCIPCTCSEIPSVSKASYYKWTLITSGFEFCMEIYDYDDKKSLYVHSYNSWSFSLEVLCWLLLMCQFIQSDEV